MSGRNNSMAPNWNGLTQWKHKTHWKEKRLTKAPNCLIVRLLLQSSNSLSPELMFQREEEEMQYIVPLSTVPFPLLIFAIFSQEQHLVAICMFNRLFFFLTRFYFLSIWMQHLSKCGLVEIYSSINPATEKQDTSVILQKRRRKQSCV